MRLKRIPADATLGPTVALPAGEFQPPPAGISEREFTDLVIAFAQAHGWKVARFRTVRVQRKDGSVYYETPVQADGAGWPDLVMVQRTPRAYRMVAAELKVGKNKPTDEQIDWLTLLELVGASTHVWHPDDWDFIVKTLT